MGSCSKIMEGKGSYPPEASAPEGAYPSGAPPPGAYPQAPPSYDATFSGATGGFAEPGKMQSQPGPPSQQMAPPVQNVVVMQSYFGPESTQMQCPYCQSIIRTSIESEASGTAWVLGAVLCILGLWCCACIPCCMDSLQDVTHRCPNCNNVLGRYKGKL